MSKINFTTGSQLETTVGSQDDLSPVNDTIDSALTTRRASHAVQTKSIRPISKLKSLRKAEGYTLEQLSQLTGISPSYLSRLEAGDRRLNTDLIQRLSEVFQCSPADLLQTPGTEGRSGHTSQPRRNKVFLFQRDLPVYAIRANEEVDNIPIGAANDAQPIYSIYDDEPVDWAFRPAQLGQVSSAFAVYLTQPSFGPKYDEGELLLIHPSKPLTKGCASLAIRRDNSITLGQFNGWLNDELELSSYSTNKNSSSRTVTLKKSELKALYRIIGTLESN